MKILSWNVNGLRAFYKKGAFNSIFEVDPDIFCLQETKAHPDDLPEEVKSPAGYYAYFDHSKAKKGYSGVAIYSKIKPEKVEYGIGIPKFDDEGRTLVAYYKDFVLLNIYFPNGGGGEDRLAYKLEYYNEFLKFTESIRKTSGPGGKKRSIIFCGDVNTAHNEIDIARPKENANHTGFLPIERAWLDKVESKGYLDTFRTMHSKEIKYSWWDMKTYARDRGIGWRLDYFFISPDLLPRLKSAQILDNMLGSDHCPVLLELK